MALVPSRPGARVIFGRRMAAAMVVATACLAGPGRATATTHEASAAVVPLTYAALGDSYSSGEGNPPFDSDSQADGCDRSSHAWPRLIATQHPIVSLVAHVACSGATSSALFGSFKTEPAQITRLQQLSPAPTFVSVTIGGNDLGFSSLLTNCFLFNCVFDGRVADAKSYLETTLPAVLVNDYAAIKAADPTGHISVVGYPQLLPSGSAVNCSWLAANEKTQLNALTVEFDTTMANAAASAGVRYVSVLSVLAGHEMCTSNSWVYPIGFTGGDLRGHPTGPGQQALADYIFKAATTK